MGIHSGHIEQILQQVRNTAQRFLNIFSPLPETGGQDFFPRKMTENGALVILGDRRGHLIQKVARGLLWIATQAIFPIIQTLPLRPHRMDIIDNAKVDASIFPALTSQRGKKGSALEF